MREDVDEPSILLYYLLANCQPHAKAATIFATVDHHLQTLPAQRRLEMPNQLLNLTLIDAHALIHNEHLKHLGLVIVRSLNLDGLIALGKLKSVLNHVYQYLFEPCAVTNEPLRELLLHHLELDKYVLQLGLLRKDIEHEIKCFVR